MIEGGLEAQEVKFVAIFQPKKDENPIFVNLSAHRKRFNLIIPSGRPSRCSCMKILHNLQKYYSRNARDKYQH